MKDVTIQTIIYDLVPDDSVPTSTKIAYRTYAGIRPKNATTAIATMDVNSAIIGCEDLIFTDTNLNSVLQIYQVSFLSFAAY